MATVMKMPKMGVNMTEGTIMEWISSEGSVVQEGDHLLTAETDKAAQEIYASDTGILAKKLVEEGQLVQCQEPIAVIAAEGEILSKEDIENLIARLEEKGETAGETALDSTITSDQKSPSSDNRKAAQPDQKRVKITPLAKKLAGSLGIDYTLVPPSAPGERITKEDIEAYARSMPDGASPDADEKPGFSVAQAIPLTGIRRTIAEKMSFSVSSIPRAVLNVRVDAEELIQLHEDAEQNGNRISYTDLIIKAAAVTIKQFPLINSRIIDDQIAVIADINIGVAIDTDQGLMVPVIHHADSKGVSEIHRELREKASRGRNGTIKLEDLQNGTFTITNLGMLGIEQFIPIINPPECAILAVGVFFREPAVAEGSEEISIRTRFWLSLAFDHRIIDGAPAGKFLSSLKTCLESPMSLAD